MTITTLVLDGTEEDLDVTLGNLLSKNWDKTKTGGKTPQIKHGGGDITNRRAGPTRRPMKDQIRIKIIGHSNDEENSDSSKTHNRMQSDVEYKIETESKAKNEMFMREINRILAEAHPTSGVQVLKSDGKNSKIIYFSPPVPDWTTEVPDVLKHGTVLYSGTQSVEWAFERS